MEGLEISVLKLNDVLQDNFEFRYDSEFFSKKYLLVERILSDRKRQKIGNISKVSDGDHSKFPENQLDEVRYLQAKDIKNYFIEDNNPVFVSKIYFDKNKRSHIKEENIIMSIMGSVGDISITPKGFIPTLANRAIAIIKDINKINPYFLFIYLSSRYGQLQINRQKNGGVQERINLDVLSKVEIPILNINFQNKIEGFVKLSQKHRYNSQQTYQQAEALLLEELGLNEKGSGVESCSRSNYNIKSFSESFSKTGRIDAEYYQPKYEEYISIIQNYKNGFYKLQDIGKFTNGSFIPESYYVEKSSRAYIRIKELSYNQPLNKDAIMYISNDFEMKNETQVFENDYVFATIGNTIGKVNLIQKEFSGSFPSNNTSKFSLFDENSNFYFYELLFRSLLVQEQIQREFTQTAQPKISNESLSNILIPKIEKSIQEKIASLIQESFLLKKQSEELLELAKKAVEIAIEEGEEKGMAVLEKI